MLKKLESFCRDLLPSVLDRRDPEHVYKMSLCIVHGRVHPEHDRYRLEFFYQSRIPCVWSMTGLFVVYSLFTSFCRDTSCQARPFCRENIVPLCNLGGSNPSRVNSRGCFDRRGKINMTISHSMGYWRCGTPEMATFISVGTGNTPPHRKHRHSQSDFGSPILSPHFASLSRTPNPSFKDSWSLGMSMFVFTCLELLHSLGMLFKCFGVHVDFLATPRTFRVSMFVLVFFFHPHLSPLDDKPKIPQKLDWYRCLC